MRKKHPNWFHFWGQFLEAKTSTTKCDAELSSGASFRDHRGVRTCVESSCYFALLSWIRCTVQPWRLEASCGYDLVTPQHIRPMTRKRHQACFQSVVFERRRLEGTAKPALGTGGTPALLDEDDDETPGSSADVEDGRCDRTMDSSKGRLRGQHSLSMSAEGRLESEARVSPTRSGKARLMRADSND